MTRARLLCLLITGLVRLLGWLLAAQTRLHARLAQRGAGTGSVAKVSGECWDTPADVPPEKTDGPVKIATITHWADGKETIEYHVGQAAGGEMRILICGDRNWADEDAIRRRVEFIMQTHDLRPSQMLIIEGGATGADALGRKVAESMGIAVAEFPANWDLLHRAAGPIRNGWMLRWGMPDLVLAFHPYMENSKGTKDMVTQAKRKKVETYVYDH